MASAPHPINLTPAHAPLRILEGKLAIVTGGARGIGAATCDNLAAKGASLVINYTSDSSTTKAQELAQKFEHTHHVQCLPVQADMGSESGPAHLIDTAVNHFSRGESNFQIDIIVQNAGIGSMASIEESNATDFAHLYNVNVRGPLLLMKAAMPFLPNDRSGRIVNVSSIGASLGFERLSIYGGTKAALEAMTRTWARELAERATVNAVNPGPVATELYSNADVDLHQQMKRWLVNTPLAAIRPQVDREDLVANAEIVGGRPVCSKVCIIETVSC